MSHLHMPTPFQRLEKGFHFFFPPFLSYCFVLCATSTPSLWLESPLYGLNESVGEFKSSSGQLARSPTLARLNPSASSPNFFKYLRHNSSGEQSGHFAQKR